MNGTAKITKIEKGNMVGNFQITIPQYFMATKAMAISSGID